MVIENGRPERLLGALILRLAGVGTYRGRYFLARIDFKKLELAQAGLAISALKQFGKNRLEVRR